MNSDGSGKKNLGPGRDPAFSPDGEMITFAYSGQIWKMRADSTERTPLNPDMSVFGGTWTLYEPSWQPILPTNKAECTYNGYKEFGFENQGRCIMTVEAAS